MVAARLAVSIELPSTVTTRATSTERMPITTSSSSSVKPWRRRSQVVTG